MTYEEIVKFHGHECPGLAIGYRMTLAAMEKLDSSRSEDEELVAIVENDACGVDALQCLTGCTFGKGNLNFLDYGKHVYTLYSRNGEKAVKVALHYNQLPNEIREDREKFRQWLLSAPAEDFLAISQVEIPEPEPAQIRKSVKCAICGQGVMESKTEKIGDEDVCMPCFKNKRTS